MGRGASQRNYKAWAGASLKLDDRIDRSGWIYELINNGVYRCGFATKPAAYAAAERDVHAGLERADALLASQRFLCGAHVTEADVLLLPTVEVG